jgi:DNA-binding NarL/FixJ family response regulator
MKIVIAHGPGLMAAGVRRSLELDPGFVIVGETHEGGEVLLLVERTAPEVVLLDLRLPGERGFTLLDDLRVRHPEAKVVMCSMPDDGHQIEAAFRRGASGCLLETISPIDVGSAVRQAVERTAYHALGLPAIEDDAGTAAAGLTKREGEVLRALAGGLSNKQVGAELGIRVQTVKFHLTGIYRKLGVANRTEAVRWALDHGLNGTHA